MAGCSVQDWHWLVVMDPLVGDQGQPWLPAGNPPVRDSSELFCNRVTYSRRTCIVPPGVLILNTIGLQVRAASQQSVC